MYLPFFIVPSLPQITYFTTEDNLEMDIRPNLRSVIQVSNGSMDVIVVPCKSILYAFKCLRIQSLAQSTVTKWYE